MYLPDHFRCDDTGSLHAAVVAHPLGTLITQDGEQVVADEVPFLLDPTAGPLGTLRAHVARNNPLWLRHSTARPVLVVFKGPQAYVSPAWYPGKAEHGKVVPTWNYCVVQASGPLRVHDDAAWVRAHVEALTEQHEAHQPKPWHTHEAPSHYIDQMVKAVVGIEIALTHLVGKFKLSQNHPATSQLGVVQGLQAAAGGQPGAPAAAVAHRMLQILQK